jgi:hypothetical protein
MTKTFGRYDRESMTDYLERLSPIRAADKQFGLYKHGTRVLRDAERLRYSSEPVSLPRLKFLEGSDE